MLKGSSIQNDIIQQSITIKKQRTEVKLLLLLHKVRI